MLRKHGYHLIDSPNLTSSHQSGKHPPHPPKQGIVSDVDPELRPLQEQVNLKEQENIRLRQELNLLTQTSQLAKEKEELEGGIMNAKLHQKLQRMMVDEDCYLDVMRSCLVKDPSVRAWLISDLEQLGFGSIVDKKIDSLLREKFKFAHCAWANFPINMKRMGHPDVAYPVSPDLPWDERRDILHDLDLDRTVKTQNIRLYDFRCVIDGTPLGHIQGASFGCLRFHGVQFQCPECRSSLTYDGQSLFCYNCWRKVTDT